jgi:hypothetical protein
LTDFYNSHKLYSNLNYLTILNVLLKAKSVHCQIKIGFYSINFCRTSMMRIVSQIQICFRSRNRTRVARKTMILVRVIVVYTITFLLGGCFDSIQKLIDRTKSFQFGPEIISTTAECFYLFQKFKNQSKTFRFGPEIISVKSKRFYLIQKLL